MGIPLPVSGGWKIMYNEQLSPSPIFYFSTRSWHICMHLAIDQHLSPLWASTSPHIRESDWLLSFVSAGNALWKRKLSQRNWWVTFLNLSHIKIVRIVHSPAWILRQNRAWQSGWQMFGHYIFLLAEGWVACTLRWICALHRKSWV